MQTQTQTQTVPSYGFIYRHTGVGMLESQEVTEPQQRITLSLRDMEDSLVDLRNQSEDSNNQVQQLMEDDTLKGLDATQRQKLLKRLQQCADELKSNLDDSVRTAHEAEEALTAFEEKRPHRDGFTSEMAYQRAESAWRQSFEEANSCFKHTTNAQIEVISFSQKIYKTLTSIYERIRDFIAGIVTSIKDFLAAAANKLQEWLVLLVKAVEKCFE